jgi:hypothetical protein
MIDVAAETVQNIADLLRLTLSDHSVLLTVSQSAQLFLIHVLEDALTLSSSDRRLRLSVRDLNESLQISNSEPLYGYSASRVSRSVTVPYSAEQELIAFRDPQKPISFFVNVDRCRYPQSLTFDATWLIFDNRVLIAERPFEPAVVPEASMPECRHHSPTLREYFERTMELFRRGGSDFEVGLSKMARSDAIGELLPYYLEFIVASVRWPSPPGGSWISVVKLARVLVANEQFNVVDSVDTIVSIALTILFTPNGPENGRLGEEVAELIQSVCDKYSAVLRHLRMCIGEELLRGMGEESCDGASFYGALCCFLSLGMETMGCVLLPRLPEVCEWTERLGSTLATDGLVRVLGTGVFCDRCATAAHGHMPFASLVLEYHRKIADLLGVSLAEFDCGEQSFLAI